MSPDEIRTVVRLLGLQAVATGGAEWQGAHSVWHIKPVSPDTEAYIVIDDDQSAYVVERTYDDDGSHIDADERIWAPVSLAKALVRYGVIR